MSRCASTWMSEARSRTASPRIRFDQLDDRRLVLAGAEAGVDLLDVLGLLDHGRDLRGVLADRPRPGELVADLAVGRDQHLELGAAGVEADVVERQHVRRVGGGDDDPARGLVEHEHPGALGDRAGQQPDDVRRRHRLRQVDHLQAEQAGQGLGDVLLGREAQVGHHLPEPPPGAVARALLGERRVELLGGEQPGLDQDVAQPLAAQAAHGSLPRDPGGSGALRADGRHLRCLGTRRRRALTRSG